MVSKDVYVISYDDLREIIEAAYHIGYMEGAEIINGATDDLVTKDLINWFNEWSQTNRGNPVRRSNQSLKDYCIEDIKKGRRGMTYGLSNLSNK